MKKIHLDNCYKNVLKEDREILKLGLPITLVYKNIFNTNSQILQVKYDLTHSEFDVLASLTFNGKIMSPTNLYDATVFSSGGMTKILKKLKDKKLITRVLSKDDKRSSLVKIEAEGEKLMYTALQDLITADTNLFSILNSKEKELLKPILKKLVYSLI